MAKQESIPAIPVPERIDVTNAPEVAAISDWLRTNAIQVMRAHDLVDPHSLSVAPRPDKETDDAINDYTTMDGLNTISADIVNDANRNLFATHGVVLPTSKPQNFGPVGQKETIFIRSGALKCTIDGEEQRPAVAGTTVYVDVGQELTVMAEQPTDYICFYGDEGKDHFQSRAAAPM